MTDYFVDSTTGSDGDSGLTMDLACESLEYVLETLVPSAGDIVWIRRLHSEPAVVSTIALIGTAQMDNPVQVIGWPRAAIPNTIITSASWANGSTTVDLVVGVTLSTVAHCGRWITAPNGSKFLITKIIDSNTLVIDREYSGPTVTLTNGLFQIEADEDYVLAQDINDSGWTITKVSYNADAHDLPLFAMGTTYFYASGDGSSVLKNINATVTGNVTHQFSRTVIKGCIFSTTANWSLLTATEAYLERIILTGNSTGASQRGCSLTSCKLIDAAIYAFGDYGAGFVDVYLENVNIGVEDVNSDSDMYLGSAYGTITGRDVKLGSTTKFTALSSLVFNYIRPPVMIENYQKVLGDHKAFSYYTDFISKNVVAGSGDPYKRSSGADKIIEIDCSESSTATPAIKEQARLVFSHEFETGVSSKSYRYYVQCKALSLTASELWLEVEYVDSYDDTSEYTTTKEESDEACSARSDETDWTQYIEVTGIAPAVASKVRIRCFVAKYDADGYIYIDPQAVVS